MPKDYFSIEDMTPLSKVPIGGRIHFIGVCGVAMGQLAVSLADKGYQVSGSDKEFYEPMGSFLKNSSVTLLKGYGAENLSAPVDLVVIGNAISYGHPEVDVIEQKRLPYTCFPRLLRETVISDECSIVLCGTHGKSTTTAMVTSILKRAQKDPSYFIGAVSEELGVSLYAGSSKVSVVEGDEYDDVFFSKRSKFMHYDPTICVINAVEFDHADLYEDISYIDATFTKLVTSLPEGAVAICSADDPHVLELLEDWKKSAKCRFITFGENENADFQIQGRKQSGLSQQFDFVSEKHGKQRVQLPVAGLYNARNALAAIICCLEYGLSLEEAVSGISGFGQVRRRQEIRYNDHGTVLIEDFAHHPTAVALTIELIRDAYPEKKLWAVFEPRSNTSRRKVFQHEYIRGFQIADRAVLCDVTARAVDEGQELIDINTLANEISETGTDCIALADAERIAAHLLQEVGTNDVVVVMSNGSFGGLVAKLEDGFKKRT